MSTGARYKASYMCMYTHVWSAANWTQERRSLFMRSLALSLLIMSDGEQAMRGETLFVIMLSEKSAHHISRNFTALRKNFLQVCKSNSLNASMMSRTHDPLITISTRLIFCHVFLEFL